MNRDLVRQANHGGLLGSFSWSGRFEVVSAPYGYAETQTTRRGGIEAFGKIMSVGEDIDDSINGALCNALGKGN